MSPKTLQALGEMAAEPFRLADDVLQASQRTLLAFQRAYDVWSVDALKTFIRWTSAP